MLRSIYLTLIAALAVSVTSARAWDALGHMLVSQIAQDHLTPAAKAHIDEAIARFNAKDKPDAPYDLVTASCWMDDIRSRPDSKPFSPWHYVNLPFTADGMPAPDPSAGPNVIMAVDKAKDILAGKVTDPAIDKDQALFILLHVVGDIHQPLHTTSRLDDMGGNRVKVANLKDPLVDLIFSKGGNLHFFWDSAYRRIYKDGFATVSFEAPLYDRAKPVAGHIAAMKLVRDQATAIEKKYPPSMFTELGDALSWAKESHSLGYALGYGHLPKANSLGEFRLDQKYVEDAHNAAEKRIALAGYRLGALLNDLYEK